jgi:hypothetical protein
MWTELEGGGRCSWWWGGKDMARVAGGSRARSHRRFMGRKQVVDRKNQEVWPHAPYELQS